MLSELGDIAVTSFYYIHLEINNDHRNLISSHWYDLFTKRTIFCAESHLFPSERESFTKIQQPIRFRG